MPTPLFTEAQHANLLKYLSLSSLEIACFAYLTDFGASTAPALGRSLQIRRSSLYRVLHTLEDKGFVVRSKAGLNPKFYRAAYLEESLQRYAAYQRRQVQSLLDLQEADRLRARLKQLNELAKGLV